MSIYQQIKSVISKLLLGQILKFEIGRINPDRKTYNKLSIFYKK